MIRFTAFLHAAGATLAGLTCAGACAALPAPTPAQLQVRDNDAAKAAQLAQQAKEELVATMDRLAIRWRARAQQNGWSVNPATSVAAAPSPVAQGASPSVPAQTAGAAVIRSEKSGTAAPSTDVKNPAKKGL